MQSIIRGKTRSAAASSGRDNVNGVGKFGHDGSAARECAYGRSAVVRSVDQYFPGYGLQSEKIAPDDEIEVVASDVRPRLGQYLC